MTRAASRDRYEYATPLDDILVRGASAHQGGELLQVSPAAQELKRSMEEVVRRSPTLAEQPSCDKGLCSGETSVRNSAETKWREN